MSELNTTVSIIILSDSKGSFKIRNPLGMGR
jgi:hypothetical protein